MNKFKTMVCAVAAAFAGFVAQAQTEQVSFVLDIDDASHVAVTVNYQTFAAQTGANTIICDAYTAVEVKGVSPYAVKSVTDSETGTSVGSIYSGNWSYYPSAAENGKTLNVVTVNPEEARTASFTVNVDDASLVNMIRMSDYQPVHLVNGANTVKFNPDDSRDKEFSINPANYSTPLYEVKMNGVPMQAQYSSYALVAAANDVVDITAVIPDIDIVCTFVYGENAEGCLSSVMVNDQPAEIVDGKVAMKAGQKILLNFNTNDYAIESFKVNGVPTSVYGAYNHTAMEDTEFAFEAHPYGKVSATVKVNTPEAIILYRGYPYMNDVIALDGEETTIELSENNSMISWAANTGCFIGSVTVNDVVYNSYSSDYTVKDGDVIVFDAGKIVMDQKAVVWVNNLVLASTYFGFQAQDRTSVTIANGYNEIEFHAAMNPFGLSWYGPEITSASVYLNNAVVEPNYPGEASSLSYQFGLTDGDVLKIFYNETPVECTVNFNVADGADCQVVADRIVSVDAGTPFTCLSGTELVVKVAEGHIVKVNGTEIKPVEGIYTATVSEPATEVEVAADTETSISEIQAQAPAAGAVYDLSGRRVAKAGRGLYIVNGKKVVR